MNHCVICGKELTDLTSVKLGIGPVCRGKYGLKGLNGQGELMLENHACFSIQNDTDYFVYIVDNGNHQECKTVTNDIEWVLSELGDIISNFNNKRLFYMDSEGRVDEVVHNGKSFIDFKAGHTGVSL